jgi:hypothetical protein
MFWLMFFFRFCFEERSKNNEMSFWKLAEKKEALSLKSSLSLKQQETRGSQRSQNKKQRERGLEKRLKSQLNSPPTTARRAGSSR